MIYLNLKKSPLILIKNNAAVALDYLTPKISGGSPTTPLFPLQDDSQNNFQKKKHAILGECKIMSLSISKKKHCRTYEQRVNLLTTPISKLSLSPQGIYFKWSTYP